MLAFSPRSSLLLVIWFHRFLSTGNLFYPSQVRHYQAWYSVRTCHTPTLENWDLKFRAFVIFLLGVTATDWRSRRSCDSNNTPLPGAVPLDGHGLRLHCLCEYFENALPKQSGPCTGVGGPFAFPTELMFVRQALNIVTIVRWDDRRWQDQFKLTYWEEGEGEREGKIDI